MYLINFISSTKEKEKCQYLGKEEFECVYSYVLLIQIMV